MKRLFAVGLLAALCAAPARAQEAEPPAPEEAAPASYEAGIRYAGVHVRGSRGQVQEYDGKLYAYPHADVGLSNQGALGLIDLIIRDIGSTEENGSLTVDRGDIFKGSVKFDRMTHRQNMTDFGIIVNGAFVKIPPNLSKQRFERDKNILYKRTETEVELALFAPGHPSRWFAVQYWDVLKKGDTMASYYTGGVLTFKPGQVDNQTREVTASVGSDVTEDGAINLDLIRREFEDKAVVEKFGAATTAIKPRLPRTDMTAAELRWRYDAGKTLAFTGALTGRQRENLDNLYRLNAAVAAFNAAYKPAKTVSLTARLYGRLVEVDENPAYRNVINNALGNSHQLDKLTARGDLSASWRALEKLLVKAGYKVELNHRRDAPEQRFGAAVYADGVFVANGQQSNSVAGEDVKHLLTVGARADLPFDAQLDAQYKRLHANRAAFVNTPTQADEGDATLSVPLPGSVEWTLMATYLEERNGIQLAEYHQTRNTYRTGLDWDRNHKVFIGADASYDDARYNVNGWFGAGNALTNPALTGFEHVGGMRNHQVSTTGGLHGRVVLPRGFVALARGSYTWATVATPLEMRPRTDPGFALGDITPGDVRITRGTLGLEYTPEKYKRLTARASYRYDEWRDRYDTNNNGRVSYAQVGVSAKF